MVLHWVLGAGSSLLVCRRTVVFINTTNNNKWNGAQPPYNVAAFLLVGQCVNNYIVDVTFFKNVFITFLPNNDFCIVRNSDKSKDVNSWYAFTFQEEAVHGGFWIHATHDAPRGREILPDKPRRIWAAKPVEGKFSAVGMETTDIQCSSIGFRLKWPK